MEEWSPEGAPAGEDGGARRSGAKLEQRAANSPVHFRKPLPVHEPKPNLQVRGRGVLKTSTVRVNKWGGGGPLSIFLYIYPSIYPSIYLSIDLSIYPSIYLSIYLGVYAAEVPDEEGASP